MKKQVLFLRISIYILVSLFSFNNLFSQLWYEKVDKVNPNNFYEIKKNFEDYWSTHEVKKGTGYKQFKRWEYFWEQRLYPSGVFPDANQILASWDNYNINIKNNDRPQVKAQWSERGPGVIPANKLGYPSSGLGRISCIRLNYQTKMMWIGTASGGIWSKTEDGGSWVNHTSTALMSIGISDIAISNSNPNIMYAATGDADGSNMSRTFSLGVIKSTDGGNTWTTTDMTHDLSSQYIISRILVDPNNANTVLAATSEGMLKTTDGGKTWINKMSGLFFRDMEYQPSIEDNSVLFATTFSFMGSTGIYKSTDKGESWKLLKQFSGINRIAISVSPVKNNYIYAICSKTDNTFGGLYLSTDNGSTWSMQSSSPNILGIDNNGNDTFGQGFYDLAIETSPDNANEVYIGGIHVWKSLDAGKSWTLMNSWIGNGKVFMHADQHDLYFNKQTKTLYSTNDGGIYKSTDRGATWTDITNGLSIAQFYRISCAALDENMVIGGTQDNGTHVMSGSNWFHVNGGDGMQCVIDYTNPQIAYSSIYDGTIYKSVNKAMSFSPILTRYKTQENNSWITPFIIHPTNPQILFAGHKNVWKSPDQGKSWSKISSFKSDNYPLIAIAVSPTNDNYIYAATIATLYMTTDGGTNWTVLYQPSVAISYIAVDPANPKRLWVTLSGYLKTDKVMEYNGLKWTNITGSLPNVPVNCIKYQKNADDRLFIGTDIGVFYRDNIVKDWISFNSGMPNIVVNDLDIFYGSGKLRAGTFGRGLWETAIIDCKINIPTIKADGELSFCNGDSVKISVSNPEFSSYLWSSGETSTSIIVKNTGDYNVLVSDNTGCMSRSETIHVDVIPVNNLKITTNNNPYCEGDSALLTANLGFTKYEWNTGDSKRIIAVRKSGTYSVKAWNAGNCMKESSINVVFNPVPQKPQVVQVGSKLYSTEATHYQWYLNGNAISNSDKREYVLKQTGKYCVKITDANGCSNTSDNVDIISDVAETLNNGNISIYPNPGTGIYYITANITKGIRYQVVNQLGMELLNFSDETIESAYNGVIDLQSQPSGVYFIKVQTGGNFIIGKIIKE